MTEFKYLNLRHNTKWK